MYIKFTNVPSEVVTHLCIPESKTWALRAVKEEEWTHHLRLCHNDEGEPDCDPLYKGWNDSYPLDLYICVDDMVYPLGYAWLRDDFRIYIGDFCEDCIDAVYAKLAADPDLQSIDLTEICDQIYAKYRIKWIRRCPSFAEYEGVDPSDLPDDDEADPSN